MDYRTEERMHRRYRLASWAVAWLGWLALLAMLVGAAR